MEDPVSFTTRPLYSRGKSIMYTLIVGFCEPQRRKLWGRNIFRLPEIDPRFLECQSRNLVTFSSDVCRHRPTTCLWNRMMSLSIGRNSHPTYLFRSSEVLRALWSSCQEPTMSVGSHQVLVCSAFIDEFAVCNLPSEASE